MNAQQMRAALANVNVIKSEKDTALGVMLASAQHYLTTKSSSLVSDSKSALENMATGYTFQRNVDNKIINPDGTKYIAK